MLTNIEKARLQAHQFNVRFPVGSLFKYYAIKNSPGFVWVNTRSKAWGLDCGEAIVKITGISGGVSISHLKTGVNV